MDERQRRAGCAQSERSRAEPRGERRRPPDSRRRRIPHGSVRFRGASRSPRADAFSRAARLEAVAAPPLRVQRAEPSGAHRGERGRDLSIETQGVDDANTMAVSTTSRPRLPLRGSHAGARTPPRAVSPRRPRGSSPPTVTLTSSRVTSSPPRVSPPLNLNGTSTCHLRSSLSPHPPSLHAYRHVVGRATPAKSGPINSGTHSPGQVHGGDLRVPNSPDLSDPMLSGVRHRFEERPHPSSCPRPSTPRLARVEDEFFDKVIPKVSYSKGSRPSQRPSTLKENFRI